MDDEFFVKAPADFLVTLSGDWFDEVVAFRGGVIDTLLTVVPTGLEVTASMATILVARDAGGDLVEAIRAWTVGKARSGQGSHVTIEVSAWRSSRRAHLRLDSRDSSSGKPPEIDTGALTALVESLFEDVSGDKHAEAP